jgi:hypothetical protein
MIPIKKNGLLCLHNRPFSDSYSVDRDPLYLEMAHSFS